VDARLPPARRSARVVALAAQRTDPPLHYLHKPLGPSHGSQGGSELNQPHVPKGALTPQQWTSAYGTKPRYQHLPGASAVELSHWRN
jgi:hypothetical protein